MCLGTFSRRARSLATCFCFARVRIIGTLVPFCVIGNSKEFPTTQKSRESSTDRGFLCYTYRSIRPARSVFHAHKYDSTSYTCRSSSYSSAWLYSDASDLSPFSLYSLIPDRNYLFMKIHPFSGFVKCFLNF